MKIVPISVTSINWPIFVSEINDSLGRSPTRGLDSNNIKPGNALTFIQALGEFQNPNSNPFSYLTTNESLEALKLITITFLCDIPDVDLLRILKCCCVHVFMASDSSAVLLTGTLAEWRSLILTGRLLDKRLSVHSALKELNVYFTKLGFNF